MFRSNTLSHSRRCSKHPRLNTDPQDLPDSRVAPSHIKPAMTSSACLNGFTDTPSRCSLFCAPGVRERFENPVLQQAGAGAAFPFGDGVDPFQVGLGDSNVDHACRDGLFSCWHSITNNTRHCAYSTNAWSAVVARLLLVGAQMFSSAA